MTKYLNASQMDKAIKSISTRGAKLAADIQVAALSAINHLAEHGDPIYINRLYLAMPAGTRKSSLGQWFVAYGAVAVNEDKATKATMPFVKVKGAKVDLIGGTECQWHEAGKPESLADVFDIKKALAHVLARASKDGVKVNDPALLRGLNALVGDKPTPAKATKENAPAAEAPAQASLV